jgi:hypothetical protein
VLRAQDCSRNMLTITGPNSYVATRGVQALNLTNGFTLECWAKVSSAATGAALMDKGDYGIFLNNDSILFGMIHRSTPFREFTPPIDSPAEWHHFAFVVTPGDSMRFYVDTIEVASEQTPVASIDSNTDSLRIGMSMGGVGFVGSVDELRIWNTPRTLAVITQTLDHTLVGNDSGLVLYYSFDDVAGSKRVHDFSEHGRDGFLQGANAEIVPSSSPIANQSPGFALATLEARIIIPTLRCASSFDTVIHLRNLGYDSIYVDTAGFHLGVAFSIVPNVPFTLPPDSNIVDSLRLHFEPGEGGVFDDSLYIASSSVCGGRTVIGLQAAYDSVGLRSSPDTLNFGTLTQCQLSAKQKMTLTNTSITDSVTIVGVIPPPGSGVLILDSFPIRLAARQDTSLTVELTPGPRGPLVAAIGFDLNKCGHEVIVNVRAVRALAALSMPANINFGTVPSTLAGITRDTTVVVTNSGDVANEISAISATPDSILEILDKRTGILIPVGDTLQVRIRLHATTCGLVTAQLKLASVLCSADTATTLSITLTPPAPLTTPALNMGISCHAQRDTTIVVSNPNDIPVALDTITFSTNSIFENFPFFPDTIPAHDSVPVQLWFNPGGDGNFLDTAFLQMSPCGTGSAIFQGQLGYAGLGFTAPQLLFGRGCKTDSVSEQDTLTNNTSETVALETNSYTGSLRFSVTPFSFPMILRPGQSQVIRVTYSPVLGALDTGTFTFFSIDGCPADSFHLRGSREIAKAEWSSPIGEFDTVCTGNSLGKTFDLTDLGIDSIDVLSASVTGSGFTLLQSPLTFRGIGQFRISFTPSGEQEYFGLLTVVVDSCGTSFSLPLHGSGGPTPQIVLSDTLFDFDSIRAGDSVNYCAWITNPSCAPIAVGIDSTALAGNPFTIIPVSKPSQLARGDTAYFCIQFHPTTFGSFQTSLEITGDSAAARTLTLRGVGLAPDVRFNPHLLDFGYVLHGASNTLPIHDTNRGNLATSISDTHNDMGDFTVFAPASLSPSSGSVDSVTFHPRNLAALVYDTVHYVWNGHTDSVIIRGFGVDSGLLASAVGLDFGNVHVGNDSTLPLYLFARIGFPTIDSVNIYWTNPPPRDTFFESNLIALPHTIANAQDSVTLLVTYRARLEQYDTGHLVIHTGMDSTVVLLTGRGVEAHPWSSPASFGFQPTQLNTSDKIWSVQIGNAGSYPLYIDSIFTTDPAFTASPIPPTEAIQPGDTLFDTVTFTPTRARTVSATLGFVTSYRDSVLTVQLTGTGIYPNGQGPSFGYTVADRTEEPGQNDSIPVTMNGIRLDKIDADSAVLDIHFDPQMVMMTGADGGSSANPVSRFTHLNDSTIEASIAQNNFTNGTVMRLYTQALLGPHPVSYIYVIDSQSAPFAPLGTTDGMFTVEDCGGLINGVIFAGPYSTNAIVPNPTGDKATLNYQIGLDGPVTLDLYNAIGQMAKHVDLGTVKTGAHTLALDVTDLPQGRYVYRLISLEYRSEGALVIVR